MSVRPHTTETVLFAESYLSVRAVLHTRDHPDGPETQVGVQVGERTGWMSDTDAARLAFALLRALPAQDDPNRTAIGTLLAWIGESDMLEGGRERALFAELDHLVLNRLDAATVATGPGSNPGDVGAASKPPVVRETGTDHPQAHIEHEQANIRRLSEQRRALREPVR